MSGNYAILYSFQPSIVANRNPRTIGIRVLNVMKGYEKAIKKEFEKIVEPWAHPVRFESEMRYAHGDVNVSVSTDDKIFNYISGGTWVRYASMRKGFVRKTDPGTLVTKRGSGPSKDWVMHVSYEHPHKGIEARNYEGLIREKYEKHFFRSVRAAVLSGWFASGYSIYNPVVSRNIR